MLAQTNQNNDLVLILMIFSPFRLVRFSSVSKPNANLKKKNAYAIKTVKVKKPLKTKKCIKGIQTIQKKQTKKSPKAQLLRSPCCLCVLSVSLPLLLQFVYLASQLRGKGAKCACADERHAQGILAYGVPPPTVQCYSARTHFRTFVLVWSKLKWCVTQS